MKRLEEIEKRCAAATEGPWKANPNGGSGVCELFIQENNHTMSVDAHAPALTEEGTHADMQFIAHARTDIPYLLELVREAAELLEYDSSISVVRKGEIRDWLAKLEGEW